MPGNPTQIFSRVFKQAYTNANQLNLFKRLTTDHVARICSLIAIELSVDDLALATELTGAAVHFVQMYATDKLDSLHAHKHKSPLEKARVRNGLRETAAEERSKLQGVVLARSVALNWSQEEDLSGLANTSHENPKGADRTSSRPRPPDAGSSSLADRLAEAKAQQDRKARSAASTQKAHAIASKHEPLVNDVVRGTVVNETLARADLGELHRRYLAIRARLALALKQKADRPQKRARTSRDSLDSATTESQEQPIQQPISFDSFDSVSNEFQGLLKTAFGDDYWLPEYVSPEALRVFRTAIANGEPLDGGVHMGHGVRTTTLGRAVAMRRLLIHGDDETMTNMALYLSHHNPTCMITKAENAADVQLRDDEMYALPSGGGLFIRKKGSWGGCRFGPAEKAWVHAQLPK
jgi:hypothetical protein